MIYTTGTIAINGNTVTGTGTNFSGPLSLIRVGCTLIAIGNPVQIFTITEIKSGTELSVTPAANPAIPAGTKFSILLSDSISVDGLAQDVAETLRYYQGKETEIAAAVEWWKDFGGDGQMDQLLANIREETAKSTANAQKTESDKNAAAASKTAAANSATAAKASQDAAKASETSASNSKTAAATSETNAAKSAADALNYRNQAQGIVGNNIGLGETRRDWPDCNDPTGYIGFCRAEASTAKNFPSIASGELYLVGWLSRGDSATINGCFVGSVTRSLYTYSYKNVDKSVAWTRHARKDEVSRLYNHTDETQLYAGESANYLFISNAEWGASTKSGPLPLGLNYGGTGGGNAGQARTNLEAMYEKKSDLGSTDINTLAGEYSGFYYQGLNANATTARGYPVSSAGALLVIRNNANGSAGCTQLYFPYNATTGTFYMRQHVIRSSSSGWGWTAWKKFQSLDFTDSPQFTNLNLVRSSDVAAAEGGVLQSILKDTSGAQRARARFYTEFRGDGKAWATTHLQCNNTNVYAGLNHDGDFALSQGSFIGKTAKLSSNVSMPLTLTSMHPTIKFDETDRPEGAPDYAFICDGGNWRIEKNHWNTPIGGSCISYNYAKDEIEVPRLKVTAMAKPANIEQTKTNMQIPFAGIAHWVDYDAPTGAEADKYYPVIVKHPSHSNGDFLCEIAMRTNSIEGSKEPNCNALHVWVRSAGWSDMGMAAFGHYFCYAKEKNAILCVRGTSKGDYEYNAIYVRGDAFPIRLAATVGSTVTIPAADWSRNTEPNSPTYKWGITDSSDGVSMDTYGINGNLLDFTGSLSGFYCSDAFRNKYGDSYLVIQANGIIQPPNGLGVYSDQDWNAQQSDGVNKFKSIAGNLNAPESGLTYGGFHVGFSGTYATQFAGRNSKFYARSFEAGVDEGWCQLATLNKANTWTATNKFYGHYIVDSSYTRFIRHIPYASTTANAHIVTWGDSSVPLNYEVKVVDTSDKETALKTLFMAKYFSDGSASLAVEGAITCTTVNQSSDRDLKDNIQVIGDATEAIRKMNGYTYTLKENGLPYAGVIAQEVMEALPEAVGSFTHYGEALQGPTVDGNELREETRYLNVDYAAVTGLLVQVARETDNRVTELEEENASLRANIAVMDERIAKLEALVSKLTGSEK
jgi:hypothetical protein